jgi:hypothetical protein
MDQNGWLVDLFHGKSYEHPMWMITGGTSMTFKTSI